jgi:hypothetical protein
MDFHPFEQAKAKATSTLTEVIKVVFPLKVDNLAYFVADCQFTIVFKDDEEQPSLPKHLINVKIEHY